MAPLEAPRARPPRAASATSICGEPSSRAVRLENARARILGAVDAMAEAHDALTRVERVPDPLLRVALAVTSSSIGFTYAGAPPCSGPESAPDCGGQGGAASAPVDAATRAVNVEAFRPCSAVQIQYVSIAFTARGSASPRHCKRNFSAAVSPARRRRRAPRPDDRRRDGPSGRRCPSSARRSGEVVACLLVGDLVELAELPHAGKPRCLRLQVGRRVAAETGGLVRTRDPACTDSRSSSTRSPQTLSYG